MRCVRGVVRPTGGAGPFDWRCRYSDGSRRPVIAAASGSIRGADNWIGLGVAIGVVVYLIIVLLFPERF